MVVEVQAEGGREGEEEFVEGGAVPAGEDGFVSPEPLEKILDVGGGGLCKARIGGRREGRRKSWRTRATVRYNCCCCC